jgi:acyl-[acyl-carrier-protein]-phospholipid O-acyltransferase/long-chain-fatty-acid--[acyl-carrier-protein] ligase
VPAAVLTTPDARKGQQLVLFTTDPSIGRSAVSEHLKAAALGDLIIPRTIIVIEDLPVLGSGKTDYVTLNRLAREKVAA